MLDFVALVEKCSVRDAALKIAEWFSISTTPAQPDASASKEKTDSKLATEKTAEPVPEGERGEANKPLTFQLKNLDPGHAYLSERGITREVAESFGIGFFSGRGQMHGRVVIPIHNGNGELVAYAGRAIDDSEPKYKFPAGFHKSLELYNLHRAIEAHGSNVVLLEGFFDAIRVHQAGYPYVALMGSSMSEEQERLLLDHFTGALLLFDDDDAGRKCTDDCLLSLGGQVWVKAVGLPGRKKPDQLTNAELQVLLK